jgi:chromosome segregation ATPase
MCLDLRNRTSLICVLLGNGKIFGTSWIRMEAEILMVSSISLCAKTFFFNALFDASLAEGGLSPIMQRPAKDKEFGQATINQVRARVQRLTREIQKQRLLLDQLRFTKEAAQRSAAVTRRRLEEARDDENELVLRFVEAKLRYELLTDAKSGLEDHIAEVRRDTAQVDADTASKQHTRDNLAAVLLQKQNETRHLESSAGAFVRRIQRDEDDLSRTARELQATTERVDLERSELDAMEERLRVIRGAVQDAIQYSTGSPAQQR